MSIPVNNECLLCHLSRHLKTAAALGDEATASAFARELLRQFLDAPPEITSPALGPGADALLQKYFGLAPDRYQKEKEESNRFIMERLDRIRDRIARASDPLYAALQFSVLGNYIDYSALQGEVSLSQLEKMLDGAMDILLDPQVYASLRKDLESAARLLYLTDNAGEICFDRLVGEVLKATYPRLEITFCVRGAPAHNDATREDAQYAGIPFPIIDNGNNVGGTELSLLSPEAKQAFMAADVILSKGQGNTETLYGSGYNIYYAFLVKCNRFVQVFGKPLMTPMLVKERQ